MKKVLWFVLGFALVLIVGGAFLLGCLPNPQASDATPPPAISTPEATPASAPTTAPALASLAWRRDGAAGCSGLRVDDLSQLHLVPCEGDAALMRFSQEELHTYLGYVARYAPFTFQEDPSPENDMSTVTLTFVGRGTREATIEEQAEMADWAAAVHARIQAEAQRNTMIATARAALAERLNIVPDVITTVAVESVTWPDACLGLPETGSACAEVETPGYRIILRVGNDTYTYHTDLEGLVRLGVSQEPSPTPTQTVATTPTPTASPTTTPSPTATATATASPTATPVPTWTPAPAPTDHWRAEYYANHQLLGIPAVVARENSVNHTWGYGAPSGVPEDHFSARWTRRIHFEDGQYDFRLEADDGVRLWVGGMLIIDRWSGGHRVDFVSQKHIPAGEHDVVVEYFELEGYAKIDLGWNKIYIPPTPAPEPIITDWRGEYYNNTTLEGPPALITNEVDLQFEWGEGSPHPAIQRDRFSARYTRRLHFSRGEYRLTAVVDDGVRVWIDGRLVIDAWQTGIRRAYTHVLTLDGSHDLRIDYFEEGGAAALAFGWELLRPATPPSPTPTATVAPPTATPTTPPPTPTATPSPTPTAMPTDVWIGEYYSNADLIGTPLVTREEEQIAFTWNRGSPHPQLPNDRFSARFSQRRTLTPGVYRVALVADDGARLYIDGDLIIDEWRSGILRQAEAEVTLGGEHLLRIEYFEQGGAAALHFGLEFLRPTGGTPAPTTPTPTQTPEPAAQWEAEYYDNPDLRGEPEITRQEEELSFDWGTGAPDRRLDRDEFSARFTRTVELPRGTYRLHLVVDDGARVYVDGKVVIDQWQSGIRRHVIHDLVLDGAHTLVIEYHEDKGGAALFFAWEGVGGAALGEGETSENLVTTLNAARAVRGIPSPNGRWRR